MNVRKRHIRVWKGMRKVAKALFANWFAIAAETVCLPDTPFLLLANHTTNLDPVLIGMHCVQQMYFVASEHIFRQGWLSKLITYLFDPIPRQKGATDLSMLRSVMKHLRQGENVCILPEGCCSYNGESSPMSDAIGFLAKSCRVTVVTYCVQGGYLTCPRWARSFRRGKWVGRVQGVYTPAQLAAHSGEEVAEMIRRDLYQNDFTWQQAQPQRIPFHGKHLAEHLECALFLCPHCGGVNTLHSHGKLLTCSCGYAVQMDACGFFVPVGTEALRFDTVLAWDKWQKAEFLQRIDRSDAQTVLLHTAGETLYLCESRTRATPQAEGELLGYADRLVHAGREFPFAQISGMTIRLRDTLMFTTRTGEHFELKAAQPRNAVAYELLYQHWCAQQ